MTFNPDLCCPLGDLAIDYSRKPSNNMDLLVRAASHITQHPYAMEQEWSQIKKKMFLYFTFVQGVYIII